LFDSRALGTLEEALALPASWRLALSCLIDKQERGMGVLGSDPEPWEVLNKVSKAIKKQFPSEAED